MDEKPSVKQTIMANALDLFSRKGYEGVSINELTEASGITKPSLYYYFKSKEGLFEAICQSNYLELDALIAEKAAYAPNIKTYSKDIYPTLSNVAEAYFSFAKANPAFFRIALTNLSMPPSSAMFKIVEKYHFTQFGIIEQMFAEMAEAHSNLKGKGKTLAWSFIGTINSYASLYLSGISSIDLSDKTAAELVHQFMHGIYA